MPVEALLLPLRMPLFCSFEIIALVGCGICLSHFFLAPACQKRAAPFFDKLNAPGAHAPGALLHQSIIPVISLSETPRSRRACISSVQLVRGEEML